MPCRHRLVIGSLVVLAAALAAPAEVKIVVDHNDNDHVTADFRFEHVPAPSGTDAATKARFTIVDGERDDNGGELKVLHDGKVPGEQDEPPANFFFNQGSDGGRIGIDLGGAIDIKQINTYSWHPNTRGPQVYTLYASDGKADGFKRDPKTGADPTACGWKLIAKVDTRPKEGQGGGQYGVSISDSEGTVGSYRYLLFEMHQTEAEDPFGNTFYSEIDVIDHGGAIADSPAPQDGILNLEADGGKYEIAINTADTPDLTEWAKKELAPVVVEWYPKIVKLLPSEGFEAPKKFSITFRKDMRGVAATGGTRIMGADDWFSHNLKGEAKGAIVHEMVHVVQQYGRARRRNPNATRAPGWLVEGIPDYIRWYLYEPQSHGADISANRAARARYDGSYRVSANFLNWATNKYDKDLVEQLNAALRNGEYSDDLWKKLTGKMVQDLGDEWKQNLGGS